METQEKNKRIILTPELIGTIADLEYEQIKKLFSDTKAIYGFQGIFKEVNPKVKEFLAKKLQDFNFNDIKRELIMTKLYFPDPTKIADTLIKKGYHLKDLRTLINAIRIKKQHHEHPESISNDQLLEANLELESVIKLYKDIFGIDRELEPAEEIAIMNSIAEVYAKHKQHFMNVKPVYVPKK